MNINFPTYLLNQSLFGIKEMFQKELTPQQKKIAAIAGIIFSLVTAVLLYCQCFKVKNTPPKDRYGEKILTYIYRGEFQNGKLNGKGEILQPNGDIWRGTFINDKIQKDGQLILADGSVAWGEFFDGEVFGYYE